MAKNVMVRKSLIALGLAACLGVGSYHVHRGMEINRVKGYLNDLVTEDNYVDMSRVSLEYNIRDFDGKYLCEALKRCPDIKYVIINDWIVYDQNHVGMFKMVDYTNGNVIGIDDNNEEVLDSLKAVVNSQDGNLVYEIPEGYYLRELEVTAGPTGPLKYDEVKDFNCDVVNDNGAYGLTLTRKH